MQQSTDVFFTLNHMIDEKDLGWLMCVFMVGFGFDDAVFLLTPAACPPTAGLGYLFLFWCFLRTAHNTVLLLRHSVITTARAPCVKRRCSAWWRFTASSARRRCVLIYRPSLDRRWDRHPHSACCLDRGVCDETVVVAMVFGCVSTGVANE